MAQPSKTLLEEIMAKLGDIETVQGAVLEKLGDIETLLEAIEENTSPG